MSAIAEPGEVVTCELGHEICEIAVPINVGDVVSTRMFTAWRRLDAPQRGSRIPKCPECGALFIDDRMRLHVGSEWRPA